jgi:hypothetical protein
MECVGSRTPLPRCIFTAAPTLKDRAARIAASVKISKFPILFAIRKGHSSARPKEKGAAGIARRAPVEG